MRSQKRIKSLGVGPAAPQRAQSSAQVIPMRRVSAPAPAACVRFRPQSDFALAIELLKMPPEGNPRPLIGIAFLTLTLITLGFAAIALDPTAPTTPHRADHAPQ